MSSDINSSNNNGAESYFYFGPQLYILIALSAAALYFLFADSFAFMLSRWLEVPEYSHGSFLPFLALFLVYSNRDEFDRIELSGSWLGMLVFIFGILVSFIGEFSTYKFLSQYGFVICLFGLALSWSGFKAAKHYLAAIIVLFMMVPLPSLIFNSLSAQLQLVSSALGVLVIEAFGIPVFLEGNVIDLGSMKLQVVEACSGLRYLFPLMTIGFIVAIFFQASKLQKAFVFLSTIPITIFMNSFRIGVIGVTVEFWGQEMAEGFLHDFEGWVVFMVAFLILFVEMFLISKYLNGGKSLEQVFALTLPMPRAKDAQALKRKLPTSLLATVSLLLVTSVAYVLTPERKQIEPQRDNFQSFPIFIGEWRGRVDSLSSSVLSKLQLDDYILANYRNAAGDNINFYSAYYASQQDSSFVHSPKRCIPGGGWEIDSFEQVELDQVFAGSPKLLVNKSIIRKGDDRQLVYYWFKQRDRIVTGDIELKWYIFWDSLQRNRSDGALIRLITPIALDESVEQAEQRLDGFLSEFYHQLPRYIPN